MPLSPEDVVNKRFNPTRVREGYAQDEVDDFLDEVVAELRRLNSENAELTNRLQQCQARVRELTEAAAARSDEATPVSVSLAPPAPAPAAAPEPEPAPVAAAAPDGPVGADQAAGVLALAQRLHDEYVRDGEAQREALIGQARAEAERVVAEAEARRDRALGELEGRRQNLEDIIHQLRGREAAYREQLDHYISSQLEDLRRSARVIPTDEPITR